MQSQHTYIFDDPNEPEALLRLLRQILLEKLSESHLWQGKEAPPNEDRSLLPCVHGQG